MKRTIRLKESELRRMISESVRRILNETDGIIDGGRGYDTGREWIPTDKEDQMRNDWEDIDNFYLNQEDFDMANEFSGPLDIRNYANDNVYPNRRDWGEEESAWIGHDSEEHNDQFKSDNPRLSVSRRNRNNRYDLNGAMTRADQGPLHRKGSLNRAMDESINRIVSNVIRRNIR